MFTVIISEAAQLEFEDAYVWYELKHIGLGDDLALCYEEALATIARNPYFQKKHKDFRTLRVRRFPYKIVYRLIDKSTIKVDSFFHTSRNPKRWMYK